MHIYITNLISSTDRKLHMEKQMKRTHLSYEFYDCVIGARLSEEEIKTSCDVESINKQNEKVEWFNRGIIGCTMTNQNVYRDMIKRNIDYALYLEDDTLIPENLGEILEYTKQHIRQGDVIMLFWKAWDPLELTRPLITTPFGFNYYIPQNIQRLSGGSAFIVTKSAAQKMLELNTPIHTTPDNWGYFYQNKCFERLLCAYPLVIQTADLKSTMRIGRFLLIRDLIDRHKIFPFYQLLKLKRKSLKKQSLKVIFMDEKNRQ